MKYKRLVPYISSSLSYFLHRKIWVLIFFYTYISDYLKIFNEKYLNLIINYVILLIRINNNKSLNQLNFYFLNKCFFDYL